MSNEQKLSLERGAEGLQREQALRNAVINKLQLQDGDVLQTPDGSYELMSQLAQSVRDMGLKNVMFICGDIKQLDEAELRTIAEPFLAKLRGTTAELRQKVCSLQLECQQLKDTRDEFEKAGNQLADDKERLQGEIERLIIQDNANARVLAKTQEKLKAAEAEVKRLREMEPDRLKAQVKRLQKKRTEAVAGAQKMRTRNHQLAKQNRQLDIALDKAIAQANAVQELKPERVFEPGRVGRWELFTCPKDGWYQLLDTENEVSQTVRVEGSELITPKIRPVPKAIAGEVLAFHQAFFGGAV